MNKEQIIELAKQAGMCKAINDAALFWYPEIERFAQLIRNQTLEEAESALHELVCDWRSDVDKYGGQGGEYYDGGFYAAEGAFKTVRAMKEE